MGHATAATRRLLAVIAGVTLALPSAAAAPQAEVLLKAETGPGPVQRPQFDDDREAERAAMVRGQIRSRGVTDPAVLEAMGRVPRHEFVPDDQARRAYSDSPLPIGHGQTISQPYIVAFMSSVLDLQPDARLLEVGTGSAYQAAILAELVREVVSIEIIEPLARQAAARLNRLGFGNVTVLHGDGYYGWPEAAPYDAVVVTAAATHVPPPLIAQLRAGGRMVIPVGRGAWTQNLLLVEKDAAGEVSTRNLMAVRFVPLTGDH